MSKPFKLVTQPVEKKNHCAHCGVQTLSRSNVQGPGFNSDDGGPQEGDISVCDQCAEISVYDEDLVMQKPPEGFEPPPQVILVQQTIRLFNELHKRRN